jgi:hypothetical protein
MTKGFYGPTTADPRSDDRASVIWRLQSGSSNGDDHPAHRHRLRLNGGLARQRSYAVRDLLAARDLAAVKSAATMPSWNIAFAAFMLNGFQVEESEADLALASLRRDQNPNQLIDCIVRTHDQLAADLDPVHAAAPGDILFFAATLPLELRPRSAFFAWGALTELIEQHESLLEEVERLRRRGFGSVNEGAGHRHDRLNKALKKTVTDRAETYMAVLALDRFATADSTAEIARDLNTLVKRTVGNPTIGDQTNLIYASSDRLERRLKDVWNKLGLKYPRGRRTAEQQSGK